MRAIIAAMAANRVIGRDGKIPWHIPEDMRRFRELTMGHIVVMGRRTWEEIGRPLPGRITCLVSSSCHMQKEDMVTVTSLVEAVREMEHVYPERNLFFCGGASIYQESMALADCIYLTVLDREVEGDTYFPEIGEEYRLQERERKGGFSYYYYKREMVGRGPWEQ